MKRFKEFQFGKIIFLFALPAQAFLFATYYLQLGKNGMSLQSFALANIVIGLVYLLFYGMTTTIDEERIRITYGIGLIRKSIQLHDIDTVTIVTNPWYYGWGIRLIPNGMLYNINGSVGVELKLKEKTRVIRIGTSNAFALKQAIIAPIKH